MKYRTNLYLIATGTFSIYLMATIILLLVYPHLFMGILPFIENIFFIGLFLLFFKILHRKSQELEFKPFLKSLFCYTFLLCMFYIAIQYILSYAYIPDKFPFDIGVIDNYEYDRNGKIAKLYFEGKKSLPEIMRSSYTPHSDMGFPMIIGFFYYIFGDVQLVIKIINAISVSLSAVLVAMATKEIATEKIAKMSGIVYAVIPTVGYLSGFFLKESIMMMLVAFALYFVAKLINRFSVMHVIGFVATCFALLYFRPYLAVCVISIFFVGNMLQYKRVAYALSSIILLILLVLVSLKFSVTEDIQSEIGDSLKRLTQDEQYFAEKVQTSSDLAKLGAPILLVLSPIFPLPSMLDLRSSMNVESVGVLYRIHIDIVRILLLFWGFLGIYRLIERRQIKHFLIFLVPLVLLVTINSVVGVLTYYRYQYMTLIFLSPFIAYGLNVFYCNYRTNIRAYKIYCFLIFVLILAYNIVRINYKYV